MPQNDAQRFRKEVMGAPNFIGQLVGKPNSGASVEVIIRENNSIEVCALLDGERFEVGFLDEDALFKKLSTTDTKIKASNNKHENLQSQTQAQFREELKALTRVEDNENQTAEPTQGLKK